VGAQSSFDSLTTGKISGNNEISGILAFSNINSRSNYSALYAIPWRTEQGICFADQAIHAVEQGIPYADCQLSISLDPLVSL